MGEVRALFCRKLVEGQKAREQDGTRSKTMEVEPLITQAKECCEHLGEESRGSRGHMARREQEASRRKIKANGVGGSLGWSA
jgi:hypothetical protein